MKFDERFIEELKSRLRPSDVIGRTVKLKRQGREFAGLSPFTKEKSPSFFVNDEKGFFHDFSSGKHGDIISFLQETERLSFVEAVERLANEAGMALPAPDPQAAAREQRRTTLFDWTELAMKWFSANLRRSVGASTREYLKKRGLPEDQWERFGLGYAPNDRDGLKTALIQKGATPGDLVEAGLLIAPEGGGAPYDRFRDRLIFPILDDRGRVVSFGGRAMNPDDRAKYLNGPESPLFHKGATLYGMPEARKLLGTSKQASLVVVEGYMDVIACQRAGIPAVAPMGTALTEEQMARLWRVTPEPVLCFDGDAAGQRAAGRAVERALPLLKPGRSFRFSILPAGQDPDDIMREQGQSRLRDLLGVEKTIPFARMLFEKERDQVGPLETPDAEATLISNLRKSAAIIPDPDLSRAYKKFLTSAYYEFLRPTEAERKAAGKTLYRDRRAREAAPARDQTPEARTSAAFISQTPLPIVGAIVEALIQFPEFLFEKSELLQNQSFGDDRIDRLISDMVRLSFDRGGLGEGLFRSRLIALGHEETLNLVDRVASLAHAPFLSPDASPETVVKSLSQAILATLATQALERAIEELKSENPYDPKVFSNLKAERDATRKRLISGALWDEDATIH
ncbi:DNA primase [Brevundimonas halotolerans]|uniref:DNA primase n=1 Tax=Brevundimonas halotolerans TaxID=69670 RepID=A0A7W9A441_9CAUL|nr:DNA primase [Brevundimonas halotolerans]MBB5661049.1 DNA primase [Brevundimonas halotolerans]